MAFYLKRWIVDQLETSKLQKSQDALPETLNLNKVRASNIKGKHMELNFDHPKLQILKTYKWFPLCFLLRGEHGRLPRYPQEASEMPRGKKYWLFRMVSRGSRVPQGQFSEDSRRVRDGQRRLEKVRRRLEKVREGQRRSEKVWESERKYEKRWTSITLLSFDL